MKQHHPPHTPYPDIPVKESDAGLTTEEAQLRAQNGLSNGLCQSATKSAKEIVLEHCLTFFNLVFVVLAVIIALSGSSVKNMTFLIVVLCNTAIGIYQELRTKRAVDKLTLVAAQRLNTLRDGDMKKIRSDLLVRDDVVEFAPGDQICADGIVCAGNLYVNESLLTGEEDAILKRPGDEIKSGSFVLSGSGRVRLTKVGKEAFATQLALEAKRDPHAAKSEMMSALDRLIRVVGIALIPIGLILFYQEFQVLKLGLRQSAEATVAALVGMIPEGLYLLTSVAMAVSSLKLARKKVLVQDMNCIETLARVDVLCVDKTGTITEGKMQVENVVPLTEDSPEYLELVLSAFYSDTEPENDTARAMQEMFAKGTDWLCTKRIPFQSATKWSCASFRDEGTYVIGAPEFIMGQRYDELKEQAEFWSCKGYRVLLVARYDGQAEDVLELPRLYALALVLVSNRIRPEAPKTFAYFAQQGVTVKVISGDNPITASEVARRAGIKRAEHWVDATTLSTEQAIKDAVKTYTVFGRVTPDMKKKLIHALKKQGHTVAMTGDGVNDLLAMKEADCSIAMASGAQAACQIAQLVLLKSDFSAMPGIVGEGRRVINNIQRAATLFLVKNIFSLGLSLLNILAGWPYPMVPLHLSVISALTIGVPSFFLAMEPNYERVQGKFLPTVLRRAFPGGLTNICAVFLAQGLMAAMAMPGEQISTVCAALMGAVGLLVLFQTCKPFDKFRMLIFSAMSVALVGCFTLLSGFFHLSFGGKENLLVLTTLVLVCPTLFLLIHRIFAFTDTVAKRMKQKPWKKKKQ